MDIKKEAFKFAVAAHDGQFRKAELEKPVIFHAIDVANMLELYGYDENVVAAGLLHDTIEDTNVTAEDIRKKFGDDVYSLVMGATEQNRDASWEERKLGTIERVKTLDLRHRAVVACDKISNIEDLRLKFGKDGKIDSSAFNRGMEKKLWYWKEVYQSLICDNVYLGNNLNNSVFSVENLPMFLRLKRNLDEVEYILKNGVKGYYPDINVFDTNLEQQDIAREFHYKCSEIYKLNNLVKNSSYIVEFVDDLGASKKNNYFQGEIQSLKDDFISRLKSYFVLNGFTVGVLKDNYEDTFDASFKKIINDLNKFKSEHYDIILIDDALLRKIILAKMGAMNYRVTRKNYEVCKKKILNDVNLVVSLSDGIQNEYSRNLHKLINDCRKNQKFNIYNKCIGKETKVYDMLDIGNYILTDMRNHSLSHAKNKVKVKKLENGVVS